MSKVGPTIEYWYIRHKESGWAIPASTSRRQTWLELMPISPSDKPRLFASLGAARSWLTVWLKGRSEPNLEEEFPPTIICPLPERSIRNMEIVELKVVF